MTTESSQRTTLLLRRLSAGDVGAGEQLMPVLYDELRAAAARLMRRERGDHTLQATALVNEAWLRLVGGPQVEWRDRAHFVRLAGRAMRHVLVDHARRRRADKRGGEGVRVPMDQLVTAIELETADVLELDEALERLGAREERLVRIVELRYFAGLTLSETGRVLDLSRDQVFEAWVFARSWLRRELACGCFRGSTNSDPPGTTA